MGLFDNIKKSIKTANMSFLEKHQIAENDLEREKVKQDLQNAIVKVEKEKTDAARKLAKISTTLDSLKEQRELIDKPEEKVVEEVIVPEVEEIVEVVELEEIKEEE